MKVVKKGEQMTTLAAIEPGNTFMRGAAVCVVTDQRDPDGDIQVVNLSTGELHRYPADDVVTPCTCKLDILF